MTELFIKRELSLLVPYIAARKLWSALTRRISVYLISVARKHNKAPTPSNLVAAFAHSTRELRGK